MNPETSSARAALDPLPLHELAAQLRLGFIKVLATSGSTNTELAQLASSGAAGHLSVLFSEHQQQGKGRLGREWVTPAGSAITVSVLASPGTAMEPESLSWYTMLAALAWSQAVEELAPVKPRIKWPNDLLAGDRKICGILAQLVQTPQGFAVVVGTGINVDQEASELPVATATSLRLASGTRVDRGELLAEYLRRFTALDAAFRAVGGQSTASLGEYSGHSLRDLVAARLATLEQDVRVEFPDGSQLLGRAVQLAEDGALVVENASGQSQRILAGDVHHVRRADGKYA
ncbi:biotin--[acetyl-CoA-carboxylase] ligase [Arthrobacter sp. MYb224]|uniref:biotin--[acetyl-CoA-carboxylase] ligase n=1 Tax=Micrococcaceae TaxID=1268 RepID=UPI000CFC8908|nr:MULTISPECIES: biotin--[acetyl-CoA-carboxylase] ligase [unclassified Arthrobacter]PQZ98224.1 biotin--[acetyl-CoA-carboxylase] ligase [Arthrobacter sp. MYb224]PRA02370.1 biotin--[acetyl-CoA-carboxylase] ligase [Arthrobacter sp. MYb229]PRB50687.1 biotin--[acetyl-CoA-carboxylase] ligase [Arthrobacter sp. MYb216]